MEATFPARVSWTQAGARPNSVGRVHYQIGGLTEFRREGGKHFLDIGYGVCSWNLHDRGQVDYQ